MSKPSQADVRRRIDELRFLLDSRGANLNPHISDQARKAIKAIERADIERQMEAAKNQLKELA